MMNKRSDIEARGTARRLCRRGPGGAFTLIELMAVISIIALVSAMILPTVGRLFSASADEQARSVLGAMLSGNRAAAIENSCYTAVHVQIGKDGHCWAVAMTGKRQGQGIATVFAAMEGAVPKRMPGGIAFGGLAERFMEDTDNDGTVDGYKNLSDANLEDFTSFTVVFAPDGTAITNIGGAPPLLEENEKLFFRHRSETAIWAERPLPWYGVRALTYFPYAELKVRNPAERADYLNENAQFICLSYLTGRLMEAQ